MENEDLNKPLPAMKPGIEAVQIQHEGKPMVMLRDTEGFSEQAIALSPPGFLIAMMLNGASTLSEVQTFFNKNTGVLISPDEVKNLIAQLDKAELLETERLQAKRRQIVDDFNKSPVRKAVHVKGGYPENVLDLAVYFGKFFQHPKGPGKQLATQPLGAATQTLIAPHIDFERGGPAYAWAYQALSESSPPDMILALGVAHMSPNSPWVLTKKSYETPYGAVPVHEGLYNDVQSVLWYPGDADQAVHRTEHSLEFQAVWLKYLWKDKTPPWVPVLCSSFDRFASDKAPSTVSTIEDAIQKLGKILLDRQKKGERILILAGVDLAHVGPRFGDEVEMSQELLKKIEDEDRVSLDYAMKGDADAFYMSAVKDGHWRKLCGLSAIYTAVRLHAILSASSTGKLLTYGQMPDPMGGVVSFTSAIYPRSL